MGESVVNIALNRPVSASSSIDPYLPARGVNGKYADVADRWLCTQLPGWFCVDLGSSIYFNRWVVRNLQTSGWPQNYNMKAYCLQVSEDKTNWTTVDNSVINNSASVTDKTIQTVKGRYARVYINTGGGIIANPQYASFSEFELYQMPTPNTLSTLLLNANGADVPLTPAFSSVGTSYTASVSFSTTSVSVTPTATDRYSTINVNGTAVISGQSVNIPLNTGNNSVQVVVTPILGTPMTYTINVNRAHSAYLTNMTLQSGTTNVPIIPSFSKTTNAYTASVDPTIGSVNVTLSAEDPSATITVNGTTVASGGTSAPINLSVGTNNINVVVSAEGITQQTYTITVTMLDLYLTGLQIKNGKTSIPLDPPTFSKTQTSYTGTSGRTANLSVTAIAEAPNDVTLTVNNISATSGVAVSVPVTGGSVNLISIVVTSKTSSAKMTYNCNITVS